MPRQVLTTLVALLLVASSCAGGEEQATIPEDQPAAIEIASTTSTSSAPATRIETTTTSLPTQTTLPYLRSVTKNYPLRVWIIGDSFLELFGPSLQDRSAETGVIEAIVDFRYISGLTRPDFFDWPAYIDQELPNVNPDVAVVIFGGNDAQDVAVEGEHLDVGANAWIDLYALRVAEAMDTLLQGVDRIYWIGLPIMRSDIFSLNAKTMNAVYETEAAQRPRVTYISTFELFQDENGEYNAYLDGEQVRFKDGAHFVWAGAYRLADAVLPVIAADWKIDLSG